MIPKIAMANSVACFTGCFAGLRVVPLSESSARPKVRPERSFSDGPYYDCISTDGDDDDHVRSPEDSWWECCATTRDLESCAAVKPYGTTAMLGMKDGEVVDDSISTEDDETASQDYWSDDTASERSSVKVFGPVLWRARPESLQGSWPGKCSAPLGDTSDVFALDDASGDIDASLDQPSNVAEGSLTAPALSRVECRAGVVHVVYEPAGGPNGTGLLLLAPQAERAPTSQDLEALLNVLGSLDVEDMVLVADLSGLVFPPLSSLYKSWKVFKARGVPQNLRDHTLGSGIVQCKWMWALDKIIALLQPEYPPVFADSQEDACMKLACALDTREG